MEDTASRLFAILATSLFSFLNTAVSLLELYIVFRLVSKLKLASVFSDNKTLKLARLVLSLAVTSLAFPTVNAIISRYLNGLIGAGTPLGKILIFAEAAIFLSVMVWLYKDSGREEGK